jgi:hypothetical protein
MPDQTQARTDPQLVRFCNEDLLLPARLDADRVEQQLADGFILGCVLAAVAPAVGLRLPEGFVRSLSRDDETTVGRLQRGHRSNSDHAQRSAHATVIMTRVCAEKRGRTF